MLIFETKGLGQERLKTSSNGIHIATAVHTPMHKCNMAGIRCARSPKKDKTMVVCHTSASGFNNDNWFKLENVS